MKAMPLQDISPIENSPLKPVDLPEPTPTAASYWPRGRGFPSVHTPPPTRWRTPTRPSRTSKPTALSAPAY